MLELDSKDKKALQKFDPVEEIMQWVATASNNSIQWESIINWNQPRKNGLIHASSVSNSCDRFIFLELVGAEQVKKYTSSMMAVYDTGTAIHEQMQYYQHTRALTHSYEYKDEVKFNAKSGPAKKFKLCGSVDGVSYGWPADYSHKLIWEYKTINDERFKKLTKPERRYIEQVHVYMACLNIPAAIVYYINKNRSNQMAAYKIMFDKAVWTAMTNKISRIIELANKLELPVGNYTGQCYYCKFFEECSPPIRKRNTLQNILKRSKRLGA
jgi:hypothetical protein